MATKTKLNIYELLLLTPEEASELLWEELGKYYEKRPDLELIDDILTYTLVDVNIQDVEGYTTLITAAYWGNEKLVELLLKHPKIDVNVQNEWGGTALIYGASMGNEKMVELLLNHPGIDVNVQTEIGWTALIVAARDGKEKCVELLLNHPGIDVHLQDKWGETAWDMMNDKRTKVAKLLKHKMNS